MNTPATNGREPQLLFVRWYRNEQRLDAKFDDLGAERLVQVRWHGTDVVPETWFDTALGEVQYQRTQDALRAKRGIAPGDLPR